MSKKWLALFLALFVVILGACGDGDEEEKPTATDTATLTVTPSNTPIPTRTNTPTDTPDVPGTVDSAVLATLTAQPTATPTDTPTTTPSPTETSSPTDTPSPTETLTPTVTLTPSVTTTPLVPLTYKVVYAPMLDVSFVSPDDWLEVINSEDVLVQSPDRVSGVIVQRGSQALLASRGLLGADENLETALQNISLPNQESEITSINDLPVDLLGISAIELRAQDISTATLAYLLTLADDDYLLVVAYTSLQGLNIFEQQVVIPLLLSLDKGTGAAAVSVPTLVAEQATQTPELPTQIPTEEIPTQAATEIETATTAPTEAAAEVEPTELPATIAPTEAAAAPTTEPVPEGLQSYNSVGLQLQFFYPQEATLEQDGPIIIVNSTIDDNARVVILRGTPQLLVDSDIVPNSESPESALSGLVEESLGEVIEIQTVERFGGTTYVANIDFIPGILAAYYIVDFETEWIFILSVAPDTSDNLQENFVDVILNSLEIRPPVVEEEAPELTFPSTYTSEATGVTAGVFEDTTVAEGASSVSFDYGNGTITVYRGTPAELLERGVIGSDVGMVSAIRSIAASYGIQEAVVEPQRSLPFTRSSFTEFEIDGVGYNYIGAVVVEGSPEIWVIIEIQSSDYPNFSTTVVPAFLSSLEVAEEVSPQEGGTVPTEEEVQPTYTPLPTYTPMPTFTPLPTYTPGA